jgi:hypothetical protein
VSDLTDRIAEVIWDADDMAAKPDFAWGETTRASYRKMAETVVAELNLTEEKHTFADCETKAVRGGEGVFRYAGQESTYKGMKTVRRWVSGWVAVENNQ